jgi:hypothetical protein
VFDQLSDADWKKVTDAERWSVGVTAHHLAGAFEPVSNFITMIAAGRSMENFTLQTLHNLNAQHAKDYANCTKAETIALHKQGMALAAATIRSLNDADLAKTGTIFSDAPPMTAEQLIGLGLLGHIDEHLGSIRKTVGK